MNALTVLIGGARSGKSDLAVQIGRQYDGAVTFIATAQGLDGDMASRIARHQAERPPWPTLETPTALHEGLESVPPDHLVIIDCLTLWVANAIFDDWSDDAVHSAATQSAEIAANRRGPTVAVTNEVGLGIHPETELGRRYRDVLGRVNRIWTARADRSLFLVAGRALELYNPWEYLS